MMGTKKSQVRLPIPNRKGIERALGISKTFSEVKQLLGMGEMKIG